MMADTPMSRKIKSHRPALRSVVDVSRVNTVQSNVRVKCLDATMKLLTRIYQVSDKNTYQNVARAMMSVANACPIKCMCVGISPYENGILPPFATALSYCPFTCSGSTPSVQVMSQAMSLVAMKVLDRNMNSLKNDYDLPMMDRDTYTARFAMMLRCSYSCLEAGVAFVNSCPVVTSSVTKKRFASSLFSEWIADVIQLHSKAGFNITVISMGSNSDKCIDDAMGSYPDLSTSMRLYKTVNPAAITRMNVVKIAENSPISEHPTPSEGIIHTMVSGNVLSHRPSATKISFQWMRYPNSVLEEHLGHRELSWMVSLLVDHAPDRLLNTFVSSLQRLYDTMNDNELAHMASFLTVNESEPTKSSGGVSWSDEMNDVHQSTVPNAGISGPSVPMNPFNHMYDDAGSSNQNHSDNRGNNQNSAGQGTNSTYAKSDGPYMFPKRTQLGQLLDPNGKGVSQQMIIVENIKMRCNEIQLTMKQTNMDFKELANRQVMLMDNMQRVKMVPDDTIEEAKDHLKAFMEFCDDMVEKIEEAYGVVQGMPAVVDGDRGIYEAETMPVAGLIQREDGSNMMQSVYSVVKDNADLNNLSNTSPYGDQRSQHNPQSNQNNTTTAEMVNPFNIPAETSSPTKDSHVSNMLLNGDKTWNAVASKTLIEYLKEYAEAMGTPFRDMHSALSLFRVNVGGSMMSAFMLMSTVVSQGMSMKSGSNLSDEIMTAFVSKLSEASQEGLEAFCEEMMTALTSPTDLADYFDFLMMPESDSESNDDQNSDDDNK